MSSRSSVAQGSLVAQSLSAAWPTRAILALFACAWTCSLALSAQVAHPPEPHRHPDAQSLKSPVPNTPDSIAAGRRLFLRYCAGCHGPLGKGDGGMAVGGGQPADLTDNVYQHGSSEGEIFVVIRDGTTQDMEGWKERIPDEEDLWKLALFVKSLGKPEEK